MRQWRRTVFVAAAYLVWPLLATAQDGVIGKFRVVTGESHVVRDGARSNATIGAPVQQKDAIETGTDGSVGITLNDNTVFSIGPNSRLDMETFEFNPVTLKGSFLAKLGRGTLSVVSGDIARGSPTAMRVRTPSAILGVRGTRFLVRVTGE